MEKLIVCVISILMTGVLTGCISGPLQTEKLREVTYVTLQEDEIPEELMVRIEQKKEKAFHMSYKENGIVYIAEGYGIQKDLGCSVEVEEVYETEDALCFHTHLMGPKSGEEEDEKAADPYVAAAVKDVGKIVIFD